MTQTEAHHRYRLKKEDLEVNQCFVVGQLQCHPWRRLSSACWPPGCLAATLVVWLVPCCHCKQESRFLCLQANYGIPVLACRG